MKKGVAIPKCSGAVLFSSRLATASLPGHPPDVLPLLPIDAHLDEVAEAVRHRRPLVLEAPPGAGKTTRIPPLLDRLLPGGGEIWVLQPRRLAARLAARRVAEERGEPVGKSVGYQVRFEAVASPDTRIRFLTEGLLTRRMLSQSTLPGVRAVVFDEFHERHLAGDTGLALVQRLRETVRPELAVAVMSATLDGEGIARWLGEATRIRSEGRSHPVSMRWMARPDSRPLQDQVAQAVRRVVMEEATGDVLVFLPGAAEIRRAERALEPLASARSLRVLPLHGELSAEEQDRAVGAGSERKVILATNVAETSVTLPGVVAVVDSGLARVAACDPWSGLPVLSVQSISRSSALQRAGRAGRIRPGICEFLYTRHDFDTRPAFSIPEIKRLDLAEECLLIHAMGIPDPTEFPWFEAPPPASLRSAEELLRRLGATGPDGGLTPMGRGLLRFPVHPRLARLVMEAESKGIAELGCMAAALLSEKDIRRERGNSALHTSSSDVLDACDLLEEVRNSSFSETKLRSLGLEMQATRAALRTTSQLLRLCHERPLSGASQKQRDELLLQSILVAFPDRVGRRRPAQAERRGEEDLVLSGGGSARLSPVSAVRESLFLVAVEAEERREGGRAVPQVRRASAIEPEWLLDFFPSAIEEQRELVWNEGAERVETVSRLTYGALVLEEGRRPGAPDDPERGARLLFEGVRSRGLAAFVEGEALETFLGRLEVLRKTFPEKGISELDPRELEDFLEEICQGAASVAHLRERDVLGALQRKAVGPHGEWFCQGAPERVSLAGGRAVKVNYAPGQSPFIASRLQDFFGMEDGPRIALGRIPLVLHLLAPNHRAVQVTTDLRGFWERHYPGIRKELCRKYPRHPWPLVPTLKDAPAPRK